jgi:hypothetical protein
MSEEQATKVLAVLGYTAEELDCASAQTGIHELFDRDNSSNPATLLESFILNCTEKEFKELKKIFP